MAAVESAPAQFDADGSSGEVLRALLFSALSRCALVAWACERNQALRKIISTILSRELISIAQAIGSYAG